MLNMVGYKLIKAQVTDLRQLGKIVGYKLIKAQVTDLRQWGFINGRFPSQVMT